MHRLFLLLTLLPCLCAAAPPAGAGWNLVWGDEFEGSSLDLSKWQYYLTGPRRQATNTPGAVAVDAGNLTITTFTKGGSHFTGMVASANTFLYTYGYIEARINFDTSPGMWSAFWMQSPTMTDSSIYTTDPNRAGTEIDICEHRAVNASGSSLNGRIVGNIHWGGYDVDHQSVGYTSDNLDLGGDYHIYGMEWTPTQQKFYIDGVLRWTVDNGTNSVVSQRSEYIWLSGEVESSASVDWAGPIPAAGYGSFDTSTTKMRVDYVRVYQAAETVANDDFAARLHPFTGANGGSSSATGGRTDARAGKLAPTTAGGASLRQTLNGLWPDTGYTLSAWGNAGSTSPSIFIGAEDHGFSSTGQTLTTNAYAQATAPFTMGASSRSATAVARSNIAGSVAYVDDFLLRRHASVINGQLETGDSHAWTSAYGGAAVANDGISYGGDFTWKIPASGSSAGVEQALTGLSPSTAYRFNAWTRNGGAGLTFGVKNHGATQVTSNVAASAWTQGTVNFTTGAAATSATIFAFRSSSAQTSYADAFFLSQPFAAPWTGADVGAVGLTGTSGRLGDKFVVQATGANISSSADKCHLVHQPHSGDGTLTARILGADITSNLTKAGLMLRDTTASNSRAVALTWNAATGQIDFLRRATAGAAASVTSTPAGSVPVPPWLRLTRRVNTFTPYWSADGVSWTRVDVPRTLSLNTALLAGLVLATGDETRLGEAAFDNVALTAAVPDVLITEPTDGTTHAANGASLRLIATLTGGSGAGIQWSVVSGPGSVTFSNATAATTHATFSAPGVYQLRCSATNAAGTGTDDHTIHVTPLFAADSSLALHLKLDESTGTTATDSSGGSNHASTSGAVTWQPTGGRLLGTAALDGNDAFLTVPDHTSLDGTAAFTLSCWFKADTFDVSSALLAKRVSDTSQNAYAIHFGTGTNTGRLRIDINSNNNRFISDTVFSTGAWYHVALVFDGTLPTTERAKLYVNGALDITATETSTTVINSTAPLLIGRASETDPNYFDGEIDSVRFHRRAFSAGEIAGLANESAAAAPIVSAGAAPVPITQVAASLAGSVTGTAPVAAWSKVSGPGNVTFGNAAQAATTVTFSQTGSYVLQLTGTNATAQSLAPLAVNVGLNPALFGDWLALQWPGETNPAINGPTADPNSDGELNLYEFATAQNPKATTRVLPGMVKIGSNLEFTYTCSNAALADGVTFTVEWSDPLTALSWSSVGVTEQLLSNNGTVRTIKATLPSVATARFARLRVTQ
ncbi:MAG: family 16 glycosylhydrolase [Verrucomicrobia bacterium]|nr:family 16 glycosylhydrolase [Verrucomicrobiota bacterium]